MDHCTYPQGPSSSLTGNTDQLRRAGLFRPALCTSPFHTTAFRSLAPIPGYVNPHAVTSVLPADNAHEDAEGAGCRTNSRHGCVEDTQGAGNPGAETRERQRLQEARVASQDMATVKREPNVVPATLPFDPVRWRDESIDDTTEESDMLGNLDQAEIDTLARQGCQLSLLTESTPVATLWNQAFPTPPNQVRPMLGEGTDRVWPAIPPPPTHMLQPLGQRTSLGWPVILSAPNQTLRSIYQDANSGWQTLPSAPNQTLQPLAQSTNPGWQTLPSVSNPTPQAPAQGAPPNWPASSAEPNSMLQWLGQGTHSVWSALPPAPSLVPQPSNQVLGPSLPPLTSRPDYTPEQPTRGTASVVSSLPLPADIVPQQRAEGTASGLSNLRPWHDFTPQQPAQGAASRMSSLPRQPDHTPYSVRDRSTSPEGPSSDVSSASQPRIPGLFLLSGGRQRVQTYSTDPRGRGPRRPHASPGAYDDTDSFESSSLDSAGAANLNVTRPRITGDMTEESDRPDSRKLNGDSRRRREERIEELERRRESLHNEEVQTDVRAAMAAARRLG